jgi:DNA-binding protein HU-beta
VLDAFTEALKQGDRVNISGFGTFAVSMRDARTGRNPKTGESIEISASRSAKFRPGKQLKESLSEVPAASQPSSEPD